MTGAVLVPLFVGGVELLLIGAVILVLIFGSKATDMARDAGSAAGKVRKTKYAAQKEVDDVRGELEEEIEPVKEDVEDVEEEIEEFEQDLDEATDDLKDSAESGPGTPSGEE